MQLAICGDFILGHRPERRESWLDRIWTPCQMPGPSMEFWEWCWRLGWWNRWGAGSSRLGSRSLAFRKKRECGSTFRSSEAARWLAKSTKNFSTAKMVMAYPFARRFKILG